MASPTLGRSEGEERWEGGTGVGDRTRPEGGGVALEGSESLAADSRRVIECRVRM